MPKRGFLSLLLSPRRPLDFVAKGKRFSLSLGAMVCQPMVGMPVALRENDRNHENDKTTKTTQTATNKEVSAGLAEITETAQMTKTTGIWGCKPRAPQTTGLEISEFLADTNQGNDGIL